MESEVKSVHYEAEKEKAKDENTESNMEATKIIRATMISETTLATKKTSQETIAFDRINNQETIIINHQNTLSKAALLGQVQANSKLMAKFEAFIDKLLIIPNITTK